MNPLFSKALRGEVQSLPPIWFMRQAGRYHKHYQALRARHSFMDLCKQPELAAEVALGPVQEFDFDVSILFSDLLFPLEALGMGLRYEPGPQLDWHFKSPDDMKRLKSVDEALPELEFQRTALRRTREVLPKNKSLIGFVGGPFTLFSYAAQGGHDGSLIESKKQLPHFALFCERLLPLLEKNIELQLEGGAEVVMVFDTSAGELSPALYGAYAVPALERLARKFPGKLGYYSKSTQAAHLAQFSPDTAKLWAGMGYDHRWSLPDVLRTRRTGFVQGNFDQALLHAEQGDLKRYLEKYLETYTRMDPKDRAGWVCGLGHGVLPATPETNVKFFVDFVRERLA